MKDGVQREMVRAAWVAAAMAEESGRARPGDAFVQVREDGSVGVGYSTEPRMSLAPTCWRSASCYPGTNRPDGYLTVSGAGEVLVGGLPLSEVKEVETLLWAAQVVPVFLATGKRAPVPG